MTDSYYMQLALDEAKIAMAEDEIPVGAVLVNDNTVILAEHNRTKQRQNPLAHAEKLILDEMMLRGEKFLYDYTLYITLEPCLMCSGMIILSRIGKVVFGTADPKAGASGSVYQALLDKSFNHHPILKTGVLKEECALILTEFFKKKR